MVSKSAVFAQRFRKFASDVIKLTEGLKRYHRYEISNQIARSAISIGANFSESISARSRKELVSISEIALKEARETEYLLGIINDLDLLPHQEVERLRKEADEIIRILVVSINKNKEKLNN